MGEGRLGDSGPHRQQAFLAADPSRMRVDLKAQPFEGIRPDHARVARFSEHDEGFHRPVAAVDVHPPNVAEHGLSIRQLVLLPPLRFYPELSQEGAGEDRIVGAGVHEQADGSPAPPGTLGNVDACVRHAMSGPTVRPLISLARTWSFARQRSLRRMERTLSPIGGDFPRRESILIAMESRSQSLSN